jgi:ADP-heptose:LPS heptosyltransferase
VGNPRFLVIRGGAIGDFVMTLPALEALKRRWPESHVEVLGYPHIAALAVAGGLADHVRSLDRASAALLFVPEQPLPAEQALYVRSFDTVISYLYDPDDSVTASLRQAGARQVLAGNPRLTEAPAARHLMKPLEALALYPEGEPYPRLRLREAVAEEGRARMAAWKAPLVVHPGSGSRTKNWPLEGFLAVARRARAAGWDPVFSFGEADDEVRADFGKRNEPFPVLPRGSLVQLAAALAASKGYVGNDSGVTHVAAAVGIPVTAVFGPSDPELWASRAPGVRLVRAARPTPDALAAVGEDAVWAAVASVLI